MADEEVVNAEEGEEVEVEAEESAPAVRPPTEKKIRILSPGPSSFRGRSATPNRGRSMTPLMRFREKSCTPSTWRSITPFLTREEKEKTPFEIGPNILLQLASYQAIFDKALVMDISAEEEPPSKYITSEHSVIDRAAIMDVSNVEYIYIEEEEPEEPEYRENSEESMVRETETPESIVADGDGEAEDDDAPKKKKKGKKVAKKKKEASPPPLSRLGPADKPPPKRGKIAAAIQAQEAKAKAEAERLALEEKLRLERLEEERRLAEEEAELAEEEAAPEEQYGEEQEEQEGEHEGSEEQSGSGSRSGSRSGSEADHDRRSLSSVENFTRPSLDYGEWDKLDEAQQGIIRAQYEQKRLKKLSERERDIEWQRAREAARIPRIHVHLKDVAVPEGNNLKLTCTVAGPGMIIKWYRDGHIIERSPKYRILVNEGIVSLEIMRTTPRDSGEYCCRLHNENGDASTTAIVTVYDVIKEVPTPPTFTLARGEIFLFNFCRTTYLIKHIFVYRLLPSQRGHSGN